MLQSMLTPAQAELLRDEKTALSDIKLALAQLDAPREALDTLQQATLQLDELFLLVVVGEFNAGKSALVNALLGEKVLTEGVTPTTSRVTLVQWGERIEEKIVDGGLAKFTHPLALLRELSIVDTPGTNAVIREHERLTDDFVPRSDLVLFITSADRPLTESERQFLERIRAWGKKVVLVLNKADLLENDTALNEVRDFVLQHASQVLGLTPEFFPVSAKLAQRAKMESDRMVSKVLLETSRIEALEKFIRVTLDNVTQVRLKFENPLGVAHNLITQTVQTIEAQSEGLRDDRETVAAVEAVITAYERELKAELSPRLAEIENILHKLRERGMDFFDNTLRLTNIKSLTRGDKVRSEFEKTVLADVPQQIEQRINRLIDWLVGKDLHEWQQVMNYLRQRRARYAEQLVGEVGGGNVSLDTRRQALLESVGKTAHTIVETYDRQKEAMELATSVETAVAQVAALGASAVGLGALVTFVVTSSFLDVTGIVAAGVLAIVGLFVIPYKRKQAKEHFADKMEDLRVKLLSALHAQFRHETESAITRMKEGVAPYTRFVNAERERVEKARSETLALQQRVAGLKARIDGVIRQSGER
jgi:small GTP-binding protein